MRPYTDRYAKLALRLHSKISKKVDRFKVAPLMWELADYLESQDDGKHEQHLLMLASKWVRELDGNDRADNRPR